MTIIININIIALGLLSTQRKMRCLTGVPNQTYSTWPDGGAAPFISVPEFPFPAHYPSRICPICHLSGGRRMFAWDLFFASSAHLSSLREHRVSGVHGIQSSGAFN